MIRRKFRNAELDGYTGEVSEDFQQSYEESEHVDDIILITSEVDEEDVLMITKDGRMVSTAEEKFHAPVLDLDFPAMLIPSTTPGHFHLYLDTYIPHDKYMDLLDALAEARIIESGYSAASQKNGFTAVRAPWVKKD